MAPLEAPFFPRFLCLFPFRGLLSGKKKRKSTRMEFRRMGNNWDHQNHLFVDHRLFYRSKVVLCCWLLNVNTLILTRCLKQQQQNCQLAPPCLRYARVNFNFHCHLRRTENGALCECARVLKKKLTDIFTSGIDRWELNSVNNFLIKFGR